MGSEMCIRDSLMAVIEKRIGMHLSTCDAYVNIAGGIRMNEPAIDLAIVLALISSYKDIAIDEKTLAFGEVGLSGEIRCLLYTSPSPRDGLLSRMPSSA